MGPHARHVGGEELDRRLARLPDPVEVTVSVRVGTWAPG
jgi:23S rRNA (guanine745-N1)-methyltransferase